METLYHLFDPVCWPALYTESTWDFFSIESRKKPRRHPGLQFEKYYDELCERNFEGVEEARRDASEGFQGLCNWVELRNVCWLIPVKGMPSQTLLFLCEISKFLPCLQDIAFSSTAFSPGTNATLRCRFTSFRWRCSGLALGNMSS